MDKYTASNGGTVERFTESLEVTFGKKSSWLIPQEVEALREFFARPEAKPWLSASDGDIWELTGKDSTVAQYLAEEGRFFRLPLLAPSAPGWRPACFPTDFTAGRRLWPDEVPS